MSDKQQKPTTPPSRPSTPKPSRPEPLGPTPQREEKSMPRVPPPVKK